MKILAACESGGHLTQMGYTLKQIVEIKNNGIYIVLVTEDSTRTRNRVDEVFSKVYLLEMPKHKNKYLRYLHAFSPIVFFKVAKI